jgi:hypothetical protein
MHLQAFHMGQLSVLDDLSVPTPAAAAAESQVGGQLCGVEFAADDIGNVLGSACAPLHKRPAPPPLETQGGFPQSGGDTWAAASLPQQYAYAPPPSQPSKKKFRRRAGRQAEGVEEEEEEEEEEERQQQQPLSGVDIWSQEFASSVQQHWALPPALTYTAHAHHAPTAAAAHHFPSRSSRAAASHVDEEAHVPASHVAALRHDCTAADDVDLQSLLHRHGVIISPLCRRSTCPFNACPAAAGLSGSSTRLNKIATGFSPLPPSPIHN